MIEISFRFSRRDRSEVINSTIRMVSYKTDFFQMNRTSIPHSSKKYGHLSRLHNPFLIVLFVLEKRPHRSAPFNGHVPRGPYRSDRELFQTLSFTWLGQSFRLPSTEWI